MRIEFGSRRQSWMWIWFGVCALISASGSFSHCTTGGSWGRSPTEWNVTEIIRKDRQIGIWKGGEHRRRKRTTDRCKDNQYKDLYTSFCCKRCPAGYYVAGSCKQDGELPVCQPCLKDTYLAFENYHRVCQICTLCDKDFQIILQNCTTTSNTVCGCPANQYKNCHSDECQSFHCQDCSKCSNRQVIKNCSNRFNTQCGECQPGYYKHDDQCKPCTVEQCKNKSPPNCFGCSPSVQTVPEEDKNVKNEEKTLPFEIPAQDGKSDFNVEVLTQPLANSNIYGTGPQTILHETQAATFLEGKTLYEIINLVPVRRWKELMRLLELRDCDIERIEMDVTQSRDQQYEMLRQWSQQRTASIEVVYQALESMNLSGIVEELQTKLFNNINSLH
ncbi:tumor necrosis factor receptor superfamily member 25-like isoform X3 [Mustelus asterias]